MFPILLCSTRPADCWLAMIGLWISYKVRQVFEFRMAIAACIWTSASLGQPFRFQKAPLEAIAAPKAKHTAGNTCAMDVKPVPASSQL